MEGGGRRHRSLCMTFCTLGQFNVYGLVTEMLLAIVETRSCCTVLIITVVSRLKGGPVGHN